MLEMRGIGLRKTYLCKASLWNRPHGDCTCRRQRMAAVGSTKQIELRGRISPMTKWLCYNMLCDALRCRKDWFLSPPSMCDGPWDISRFIH